MYKRQITCCTTGWDGIRTPTVSSPAQVTSLTSGPRGMTIVSAVSYTHLDIGLLDTMEDLFVNFIGALTFSIIGYFYVRSRGENRFAKRFIPVANNSTRPKDASSEAPEKNKIE